MNDVRVNGTRLWSDLMTQGAIGALPGGGLDRMALTDGDRDARNLFAYWCREAGLRVTVDAMGNIFARRDGKDNSLAPVMMGSHLDTQSPGGKFDGILGVLAGLEVMRTLNDHGITTRRPIEVVNWTNEEGARFRPGLMGSAVFTGALDVEAAHAATDRAGLRVGDELHRIRYDGATPMGGRDVDTYCELHVEQGPELEEAGITIGAVTDSHDSYWIDVECLGEHSHQQGMPMLRRRNALVGAAKLIDAINRIGLANASAGFGSAVEIHAWPNNRIIVPNRVRVSYGLLHADKAGLDTMSAEIDAAKDEIARQTGLTFTGVGMRNLARVYLTEELVSLTQSVAAELGLSCKRMRTRTGHDAFNLLKMCDTQLIFVPSVNGMGHNEAEWTTPEDCTAGANVLCQTVLRRADRR